MYNSGKDQFARKGIIGEIEWGSDNDRIHINDLMVTWQQCGKMSLSVGNIHVGLQQWWSIVSLTHYQKVQETKFLILKRNKYQNRLCCFQFTKKGPKHLQGANNGVQTSCFVSSTDKKGEHIPPLCSSHSCKALLLREPQTARWSQRPKTWSFLAKWREEKGYRYWPFKTLGN